MPNRFTAVLDANVLYGGLHRHIALSLAQADLYRPAWSSEILEEFERNLALRIEPTKAARQLELIKLSFPDSEVSVKPALIEQIDLADRNDRHVVAAAIQTQAALVVTDNLKHFPKKTLEVFDTVAVSADQFFSDCITVSELTAVRKSERSDTNSIRQSMTLRVYCCEWRRWVSHKQPMCFRSTLILSRIERKVDLRVD